MIKQLWIDETGERFFLIPDDAKLPNGTFRLQTLDGQVRLANSYGVIHYEIKDEKARQILIENWRDDAKSEAMRGIEAIIKKGQINTDSDLAVAIEKLLNPSAQSPGTDGDKYLDELYNLLQGVADLLEAEANPTPESIKLAKETLKDLNAMGQNIDVDISSSLDAISERLGKNTNAAMKKQLADVITLLRDGARDLTIPASDMDLDAVVTQMQADLNAALGIEDDDEAQQTAREREYRKHADDAIAKSLRNLGFDVD